ncbi:hypothetical protein MHTCC0001_01930 [Flavobacteriaceae bacterium MHTCC 0001]
MILLFVSCKQISKDELVGVYIGHNYSKTVDSITLNSNGVYSRKITFSNNQTLFENKGNWELKGSEILFDNYLVNNDELDSIYKYDERFLSTALFEVQFFLGSIKIIENHDKNLYLKKVK